MSDFQSWLDHRIDQQSLTPELRRALFAQFAAEQPQPVERPAELILIPDDADQWSKAIRLEVATCG